MRQFKYIINFAYDGSDFRGYGTQLHKHTVQDTLETVLKKLNLNEDVKTFASSRTDANVHAKDQYLQVFLLKEYDLQDLKYKLNRLLPNTILIKGIYFDKEDKINVRYDVKSKTYKYIIALEKSPFYNNYLYFENSKLNIEKMKQAAKYLVGEHDFSAFCNSRTGVKSKVRNVYYLKVEESDFNNIKTLEIIINADGFLYNMVRIIAGILLEVGKEKVQIERVKEILDSKVRTEECICSPPQGLYLEKINIKEDNEKDFIG